MTIFALREVSCWFHEFELHTNFHSLNEEAIVFHLSFVYSPFLVSLHKDTSLEKDALDSISIIFLAFLSAIVFI
jgi:hypothetical protein